MTEKINKFISKHEKASLIALMTIASVFLSYPFYHVYPLHTTTDELGAIVGAAALAGYDWSGVIDKSGYYGFGYYTLFAPLFKLQISPIIIYRIILVVTRMIRGCAISGIAFYIGNHYYRFSSKINLLLLSFICTIPMHPSDYANIINDVVLDIVFWIIILSVCKIQEYIEKPKSCVKWMLVYTAVSFWGAFLHTRALVMIIASFLVLLGMLVYQRKTCLFLAMSVIPVVIFSKRLISIYQASIWKASGEGLRNASVHVTTHLPIRDTKTWEIWFDMLIGHISVQTLLTGGLFLLAIVVMIKYLYIIQIKRQTKGTAYTNIVFAISVLSMGAAFAAFLVSSWFMNMYNTWNTVEKGQAYCYKALCYVRYWNVFSMPFLFTGVYLVHKEEYRDCVKRAICAGFVLLVGYIEIIIPIVQTNSSAASFLFTYLTDRTEKVTAQFYYKCILICLAFVFIALFLYYGRHSREWAILSIVCLVAIGYYEANANYNKKVTEEISSMVLASYEQKCKLDEAGVHIGQIYAFDDRKVDSNWYIFSVLQFYFYEYRIEDEYPFWVEDEDIIITYGRSEKIETDFPDLSCYQLDENEVWYTNIELIECIPIER